MNYVYAFGGDLSRDGRVDRHYHRPPASRGYLVNVYTPVHGTWKIRAAAFVSMRQVRKLSEADEWKIRIHYAN